LKENPQVSCIILNWNGWQDTLECLKALEPCSYRELKIIVVDNGSTDDSAARIRKAYPDVVLLESKKNLGFAGGNNIGIRYALAHGADYVWLLNNDTEPDRDALAELVSKSLASEGIGAVGSVCYFANRPSAVQAWAGGRVSLCSGYAGVTTRPHPDEWFQYLNGTSLLIRREALQNAGTLDEGFFLYCEDVEFCLRLRKKGWRLAAAADSRVLHKVNASTGGDKLIIDRHLTASVLRMLKLHSPAFIPASLLFLAVRFGRRIMRLEFARCKSVWAGMRDYRAMQPVSARIN
jgi:GT2 family glycosyltransferase